MCTFHCPLRKKRYTTLFFLRAQMYTFSSRFIKDRVVVELEKTQTRNSAVVMALCYESPIYFFFQRMSLSNLFLIKFWKFLVIYLSWGCRLDLRHKWLQVTSYLMPMKIKNLSAKTTKYIPKRWKRSVKTKSNLNFIRVIKNSSLN